MFILLQRVDEGVLASELDDDGAATGEVDELEAEELAEYIEMREPERPRWVWADTGTWYPPLLAVGQRVERCWDLRLVHAILRGSAHTATSELATRPRSHWDSLAADPTEAPASVASLFDLDEPITEPSDSDELEEFGRQQRALRESTEPGRLGLLVAAESAGGLIAAEMRYAGVPWRADVHDQVLTEILGPRPAAGQRPQRMEEVLAEFRRELDDPTANPDSPADLIKALGMAGIRATSTRSWELQQIEHPAIAPLLTYKKLARLASANGWAWLDEWVQDGRFRPQYIVGGTATGRWASSGGGALQLPKQIRAASIADPGWRLVVADASQLEPRILAGLASDLAMAKAGFDQDMYRGIVDSGAVATRDQAKVAMLGAMYGATTGESARLMPKLTRTFPQAIAMVEQAARAGERGEVVSTRLGRSSPRPPDREPPQTEAEQTRETSATRAWGRFTRNFIVQGTAAEWALCWMGGLRTRLRELAPDSSLTESPHLAFFLHDEVMVHTPVELADQVAEAVRAAAVDAGRLLFGSFPVSFPVTVAIVDNYGSAK